MKYGDKIVYYYIVFVILIFLVLLTVQKQDEKMIKEKPECFDYTVATELSKQGNVVLQHC